MDLLVIFLLASAAAFIIWGPQMDARKQPLGGDLPTPVLLRWPATTRGAGLLLLALTALVILAWWTSSR